MPSYDPAEAHSMDDNYLNIENLFKEQNVSTSTTTYTSKCTDS